jgi:hypothetical protein
VTDLDELERRLQEHLAGRARRLPEHVRDAVIAEVPRRNQSWTRFGGLGWPSGLRFAAALAVTAAVLALLVTPLVRDRLDRAPGTAPSGGATPFPSTVTPSPSGPAPGSAAFLWDAVLNFRGSPLQTNPSMDGYGNPTVWSYLHGPAGVHDPLVYERFTEFDPARDAWTDASRPGLAVGATPGSDSLSLQPWSDGSGGDESAIVAWRSPIDGSVDLHAVVEVDASCGDGVRFWLDQNGRDVEAFPLARGARIVDLRLRVKRGDTIDVGVDPGLSGHGSCDAAWLRLVITA